MGGQLENLYFELTGACNLLCKHCYVFSSSKARERPDTLTLPLIERTIEDAKSLGLNSVTFTGGEIFLRPDVRAILQSASSRARLFLLTNLTLLGDEDFEWLATLNVARVSTSLDGLKNDHDSFRQRKGSFEKTLAAILRLRDLKVPVKVSVTVHPGNLQSSRELFSYLDSEGIPSSIARVTPIGRGSVLEGSEPIFFDQQYYRLFADRVSMELGAYRESMGSPGKIMETYCGVGESILYVMSNSKVGLCPTLNSVQGDKWVVGDLTTESIVKCWGRARAKFETLRCSQSATCEFGKVCRGGCRANALARSEDAEACDREMHEGLEMWRALTEIAPERRYRVV